MAQSGYTPISLYYSTTSSTAPTSGNLTNGELAINITDGKLYYKDNAGVVQIIATKAAALAVGTVTSVAVSVPGFLSVSGSPITSSGTLAISYSGTALPTTNGGTGLTSFTANGVAYASSTSALATGSAFTFDGTNLSTTGNFVAASIKGVSATTTTNTTITPTAGTTNQYTVTALASGATIAAPSGTPTDGQKLTLRFKDNGTAQTLTWTTSSGGYRILGTVLPTTTTAGKVTYVGCLYNSQDSYWDVVAVTTQA